MLRKILWILCLRLLPFQVIFALDEHNEYTHSDEALRLRASQLPQAKSVVALEADVFSLRVSTGSAVCIGPGEFLTNAHCVQPWITKNGKLKYPLYIQPKGQERQTITEIYMHEKY
ncbi:MAG: hypothetical protein JSS34_05410 [Proteobacteria bacterium]|nr:hypothetical protein [Pseudomonadota bacterium]